jgi:serine/threonine protein kinase/tetratricopeptide (TPR) repeat protein
MSDRWDRLVAAVGEAASMDPDAARAYLDQTFADDPALREEAATILDGGLAPDGFLTQGDERPPHPAGVATGTRFGEFEVERLLGRGGMGAVYLARQATPKRAVALKVLESTLLTERARTRFEYEVQALATLRHRGIAQVYETGVERIDDGLVERDVPWFAMEYVEGASTLLEYANTHALGTRDRLRLLLEVCDAVHHGHQKGVVHRDLKPDNILVNQAGHPKVIDFGVARDVDGAQTAPQRTDRAEILGTLPYLSPERVTTGRGAADVRTDVYALGVVLYQMLTGKLPIQLDARDIVTSARRICEETPPRPSLSNTDLDPDLDAIALKSLAKDPEERYASANALAADIRRFLEHRPISARPPGAWYQLRLFTRRHRALVVASGAVVVVGAAATLLSINWALRSEQAEQRANEERAVAVEERDRGARLFETVLKRSLETTLREAPRLHKMPGGAERVQAMMANVLKDLQVLESMSHGDPRVQLLVAETWLKIGDTQGNIVFANLGDRDAAEASYRHALEICEKLRAGYPVDRRVRIATVRARIRLAEILDQAERVMRLRQTKLPELRAERRTVLDVALADALRLAAEEPDDLEFASDLEDLYVGLGNLAQDEKRYDDAREHASALLAMHAQGRLHSPMQGLLLDADTYRREERWPEARAAWEQVVAVSAKTGMAPDASFPSRFIHAQHLGVLGGCAMRAGDHLVAIESLEGAVTLLERLTTEAPKDRRVGIQLHIQLVELARAYANHSQDEGADERDKWLAKSRNRLVQALERLGPPGDESRIRASMREGLQKKIDKIDAALGE